MCFTKNARSSSFLAPTKVSTFAPSLYRVKVGSALMPSSMANALDWAACIEWRMGAWGEHVGAQVAGG